MALEIMDNEKDKQVSNVINKELSKLNPCATTRISTLNMIKQKFA